jgi:hypothetical protein
MELKNIAPLHLSTHLLTYLHSDSIYWDLSIGIFYCILAVHGLEDLYFCCLRVNPPAHPCSVDVEQEFGS